MIRKIMYKKIHNLWKKGKTKSEISRMLNHTRKTIAKVINTVESGKKIPEKKPHPKILDEHKDKINEWIEEGFTSVRIHEELKRKGVKVGYSTVKDFVKPLKKKKKIFIKIITKPGEEGQVDFGDVGFTLDNNGRRRKTYVFNMRLSYSRLDYVEKIYDQKIKTFIQCHINAFKYFKGVPKYIKIDNLKAGVTKADLHEPVYQAQYQNLAEHYGFEPLACRPYRPNDKGKVESGIKYVKNNFFLGRKFASSNDLDKELRFWLDNICNKRIHGTLRKIPKEIFEKEEKACLQKLPDEEFQMPFISTRKVQNDCHIYVNYNQYSVPFEYVGKEVTVEKRNSLLKIYYKDKEIAVHPEILDKGNISTNKSHYPKYKIFLDENKYLERMKNIGTYTETIFFHIKKSAPKHWYRIVRGIISLEKKYSKKVINLSCKRALFYNAYSYQAIKNICKTGMYNLPIENL